MRQTIERTLNIRPAEFKPLVLLSLIYFVMLAGLELVGNVSEVLFFRRVGVESLPHLYSLEPVVMVGLLSLFGVVVDRVSRYTLLAVMNGLLVWGLLVARLLIGWDWSPAYPALWLLQRVFFGLFPVIFWVLCSDVFDVRQAKRLFVIILAGGLGGATIGNLLTGALSLWLHPEDFLVVGMAIFSLGIVVVEVTRRMRLPVSFIRPEVAEKHFSLGLPRRLLRQPFLQALFWLMLLIGFMEPVLRYELNALANQTFTVEQDIFTFYGFFKAGGALLVVIFQLVVARRLIEKLGVPSMLSILPMGYMALLPLLGLLPNPFFGGFTVALLVVFGVSFHSPARSSALNLFPPEERGRISASADQLWYLGWLAGSLFLIWAGSSLTLTQLNLLAALVAASWLIILPSLRHRYALTCLQNAYLPIDQHLVTTPAPVAGRPAFASAQFAHWLSAIPDDAFRLALAVEGYKLRHPLVDAHIDALVAQAGPAAKSPLQRALRSVSWSVRRGALQAYAKHLPCDVGAVSQAVTEQLRYAFTLDALMTPLTKSSPSAPVWRKLRRETVRACGEAIMLLLELLYPREQMRPAARMIRSTVPAAHATGLEALDNLIRLDIKPHILALLGEGDVERLRHGRAWLGVTVPTAREEALQRLADEADGLVKFWALAEVPADHVAERLLPQGVAAPTWLTTAEPAALPLFGALIEPVQEKDRMEMIARMTLLRGLREFSALSEEELKLIALCMREHQFEAKQVIVEEGQAGDALYLLVQGQVELESLAKHETVRAIQPGALFGQIPCLSGEPYTLTALAITAATLLSLDRETLRELIDYYPDIAMGLMRALALQLRETTTALAPKYQRNIESFGC